MQYRILFRVALLALALPLFATGCDGQRFLKVTGHVTHKGQPVPNVQVRFVPENGERPCNGTTDDDGSFTLKYSRTQAGAPPGAYTAYLTYVPSNEEINQHTTKVSKEAKAALAKYGDPKTSGLRYELDKDGQNIEINID
jgi:hypothetical protein